MVVRGRGTPQNHRMGRQETWEVPCLPVGKDPEPERWLNKCSGPVERAHILAGITVFSAWFTPCVTISRPKYRFLVNPNRFPAQ